MKHHSKNAFTLIEMLTVIAILSFSGLALLNMIQYFYKTNDYVIQEGKAVQSARNGLGAAMEELREASYGDDGSYPLATAATSTVTFYANVDNSGYVSKVRLYLSGGTLYQGTTRSAGSPPSYSGQTEVITTVATYVVNSTSTPIFQYYDSSGTLLTSPVNVSQVATVSTTLQIDVDIHRSPTTYTLLGSATLRNLLNQ